MESFRAVSFPVFSKNRLYVCSKVIAMAQTFHMDCFLCNSCTVVPLYILLPEKYTLRSKSILRSVEWSHFSQIIFAIKD